MARGRARGDPPRGARALGATAAQALLGPQIRIGRDRGTRIDSDLAKLVMVTTHPSAIRRAEDRKAAMDAFVAELQRLARWLR
jgi:DNA polymerase